MDDEKELYKLQRDDLAEAIRHAAVNAGLISKNEPELGPLLLKTLCEDMGKKLQIKSRSRSSVDLEL